LIDVIRPWKVLTVNLNKGGYSNQIYRQPQKEQGEEAEEQEH